MPLRLRVAFGVPDEQTGWDPGPLEWSVIAGPSFDAVSLETQSLGHRVELLSQPARRINFERIATGADHVELDFGHGIFQWIARVFHVIC